MATTKVTVSLPKEQVDRVKALIRSQSTAKTSAFVSRAVDEALRDAARWRVTLDEALEETGGPLTDKEREWVDSLLAPRPPKKRTGRRKAA